MHLSFCFLLVLTEPQLNISTYIDTDSSVYEGTYAVESRSLRRPFFFPFNLIHICIQGQPLTLSRDHAYHALLLVPFFVRAHACAPT